MSPFPIEHLVRIVIAGLILYFFWIMLRPRWDLQIIVEHERVTFKRGVPLARIGTYETFFLRDLPPVDRLEVFVRRERSSRLITHVRGQVDAGTKQRIRNFLLAHN